MTTNKNFSRTLLSSVAAGAFLFTGAAAASAATQDEWGGQSEQPDWDAIDERENQQQAEEQFEEERSQAREDAYDNPNLGGERVQDEDWAPDSDGEGGGAISREEVPESGADTDDGTPGSDPGSGQQDPGGSEPAPGQQAPGDGSAPGDGTVNGEDDGQEGSFVEDDPNGGDPTQIEAGFIGGDNTDPAALGGLLGGLALVGAGGAAFAMRSKKSAVENNS